MCNIYIHIYLIKKLIGLPVLFCPSFFFADSFFSCFFVVFIRFLFFSLFFFLPDSFFLLGFFFAFLLSLFLSHPISCTLPSPDQTLSPPPLLSVSQCVFSIDHSTVCEYRFSTPHFSHDFPFHFVFKYLV